MNQENLLYNIGIPAKSGVGGGIMAAVPKKMGIGIYGPSLDEKGNSIAGIKMIKRFIKRIRFKYILIYNIN